MNELAKNHCSVIGANTPRLNEQDSTQFLEQLAGWRIYEKDGEPRLEKLFKFENFKQAINFTYQVAQVADEEGHHPAILTEWGKVTVTWWSHRIKGLHLNDFIMAAKTEQILKKD